MALRLDPLSASSALVRVPARYVDPLSPTTRRQNGRPRWEQKGGGYGSTIVVEGLGGGMGAARGPPFSIADQSLGLQGLGDLLSAPGRSA